MERCLSNVKVAVMEVRLMRHQVHMVTQLLGHGEHAGMSVQDQIDTAVKFTNLKVLAHGLVGTN